MIKTLLRLIFKLCFRVEVEGLENYAKAGKRVVIIANHVSFLDAALIAVFLKKDFVFAVNTFIARKWWVRMFFPLADVYLVDQTNPLAIRGLIKEVKKDKQCLIFPEGRVSITDTIMKIYDGPGMVTDRAGATLLPIFVSGAERSHFSNLKYRLKQKWFPKIKLTIYPPIKLNFPKEIKGRERRKKISSFIYDLMTSMQFKGRNYHKTLFEEFLTSAERYGKKRIILEDTKRIPTTYHQLTQKIIILGGIFSKQTKTSENVGILLPSSITTIVAFFGLNAYNRVPVMLNFTVGERLLLSACQTAQLKTIYTSKEFCEKARLTNLISFIQKTGINVVYLEDLRSKVTFFKKISGALAALRPRAFYKKQCQRSPVKNRSNKPAIILFTSGTEGEPKGVALSHSNVVANCHQIAARLAYMPGDRAFNPLPMFHSAGLTCATISAIFSGVRTFHYPSPLHYRIIPELVYDTDTTILFGTNVFLYGYARLANPYDFHMTRLVFAGAEKLRVETIDLWNKKMGLNVLEAYGVSETSPILTISTKMQNRQGSVGRFLPEIEHKLIPVEGLTDGGELWVKGPNVMLGYLRSNKPGVIQPLETEWYDTGDVVKVDEDGFVFIQDRTKRFAKVAGEMISLSMIERYCQTLWPRHLHAVLTELDMRRGERIILLTTNPGAIRKTLLEHAREKGFPELSVPKKIINITKMPMMALGKIDYGALKKEHLE